MKKLTTIWLAVFLICSFALSAQDCQTYFPLVKNAVYEMEIYNPKQKKAGRSVYKVMEVTTQGGKTDAQMAMEVYDEKNNKSVESVYNLTCENGQVLIDMRMFMNPQMMEAYRGMDVQVEGEYLAIPSILEVGQALPDGTMAMNMSDKKSGAPMSKMNLRMYNRKVKGKESITCPAGTFDCYKITSDMLMENLTIGIPIKVNMKITEWISPGTGIVKSESARANGKTMGYSLLTKVTK